MATIPFDPPHLLTAKRSNGFVDVPGDYNYDPLTNSFHGATVTKADSKASTATAKEPDDHVGPAALKRSSTMQGNIIVFEKEDGSTPEGFWIQRKIGKSSHGGVLRLGYRIRPSTNPEFKDSTTQAWELATTESGVIPMVTIHMYHSSLLNQSPDDATAKKIGLAKPLDELSALQMISEHKQKHAQEGDFDDFHVVGTNLIGTCTSMIYTVLPHHRGGTLCQYCQNHGNLPEPLARFFFRQILKGLKTLQKTGLCHRNLSLDTIALDGDHVDIGGLSWSLRLNKKAAVDEDLPVPAPGGNNPQYIAPEYFGNSLCDWDGFAADLWTCGIMLFSMTVSSEALFAAPVKEDPAFLKLCVEGDITSTVKSFCKSQGKDITLSEDLIDLFQHMLKVKPEERLSLDEVMEHAWVKKDDCVSPSEWATAHRQG